MLETCEVRIHLHVIFHCSRNPGICNETGPWTPRFQERFPGGVDGVCVKHVHCAWANELERPVLVMEDSNGGHWTVDPGANRVDRELIEGDQGCWK